MTGLPARELLLLRALADALRGDLEAKALMDKQTDYDSYSALRERRERFQTEWRGILRELDQLEPRPAA